MDIEELKSHARKIRIDIIKEVSNANSGHPGGSLSATDILTVLYFEVMDFTKENAGSIDRDRFVLSKGHASPALYGILAEKGVIEDEELLTFRKLNSRLQGHPCQTVDGVDMSTGSLGQGLSAAVGMSLANKLSHNHHRIYCLIGDGEAEEGQIWEAAMSAAHYGCDNLCVIVDNNHLQIDGNVNDVIGPEPFDIKFEAFGWNVIKVNGHDYEQLIQAFDEAKNFKGKPSVIIADTVKGKGVSYMENEAGWHGKAPNDELTAVALKDLEDK